GRPYEHAQARSGAAGRSRRVLRGRIRRADGQRRRPGRGQRRRRRSRPRRHARARLGLRGRARSRPARRRRLSPPCQTSCVMKLSRVWELAREYWFDALVLGGLAWWLAGKVGDLTWDAITFTVAWVVGFAVGEKYREVDEAKERAAIAEREREERALRAVADERARIARELHDVVGHSVSVMTVQASAVR